MTGKERVLAALECRQADRVPRFCAFWDEYLVEWNKRFPGVDAMLHFGNDMEIVAADHSPWPSEAVTISQDTDNRIVRNGWGQVRHCRTGAYFGEVLENALTERVDPDTLIFDDPLMDSRYEGCDEKKVIDNDWFLFAKCGGPYQRTTFLRGEEQLWLDVKEDPQWVAALVERLTDHLIAVSVESFRRWGSEYAGIAVFDDLAASWGPFVGPRTYEELFLPSLQRMVKAFRKAGVKFVMHHADGNVLSVLDMWIDAGIDAINPLEYRAGMDAVKVREQYGKKLVLIGGMDNCEILPRGDRAEIREHIQHLFGADMGGGFIIGPHSIGPDISTDTMLYVLELLEEYGGYSTAAAGDSCTGPEE